MEDVYSSFRIAIPGTIRHKVTLSVVSLQSSLKSTRKKTYYEHPVFQKILDRF